nr:xylulose 5-phosphate 3-epimerase [Anaerohalosphaera lusitana]
MDKKLDKMQRIKDRARLCRQSSKAFAKWAAGYGVIRHEDITQTRVHKMADQLAMKGLVDKPEDVYNYLHAADRVASTAMWLVAHMTYARNVYLEGRDLTEEDFKEEPEGHTGGSLNMAIAYAGYLAVNSLTGITRSWLMGQGHCVSAIDSCNLIVGNLTEPYLERYNFTDQGLSRFVRDFYLQKVRPDGYPESPVGSHVNANTAGGMIEGGYLGFAELYYPHMTQPGDRLVTFLSDGAFEEQKGGDWAPRWWRGEDNGLVAPIMISNGRRIDQRTTVTMAGGTEWFREHLELYGFEPIDIDGCDPAAYAWAIWEMEERLIGHKKAVEAGTEKYPVPLPYTIADVPKGFGLPNAGTNAAHNLPLGSKMRGDPQAQQNFNSAVRELWVPEEELNTAVELLNNHSKSDRVQEKDHSIITREVELPSLPAAQWHELEPGKMSSPMRAVDAYFCELVKDNPHLRPRVGNPDEMRSNRMDKTLDFLKHRVTDPEPGAAEAIDGKVVTALNEEAVVCSALANRGGINLVASYEAFAVKMLGAVRQELIFARHQNEVGRPPKWLSVAIFPTSHAWENGKNEVSHQDPTFCEALMNEMADVSRVLFPADSNSAVAAIQRAYQTTGQIWTLVTPKRPVLDVFAHDTASDLAEQGGVCLRMDAKPQVNLTAIGSYQLEAILQASERLDKIGIGHNINYIMEPAKFRQPRDSFEEQAMTSQAIRDKLFPAEVSKRVFISHCRPEPVAGVLRPFDTGTDQTRFMGYMNRGGTLDVFGMMFANRCTWAHVLVNVADLLGKNVDEFLENEEREAVFGNGDPECLRYISHEHVSV